MWVNFAIAPWSVFGALLPSRSLEGENLHTEQPTKSELKKVFHKRSLVNRQVYPNASQVTAVRVANVAKDEFEEAVESDEPPTVTQLAQQGKNST